MEKFNPQPKPEKKVKIKDRFYFSKLQQKSIDKSIEKNKNRKSDDDDFYERCWKEIPHICTECGCWLPNYSPVDKDYLKNIRWHLDHNLPKATFPKFRHDIRNINKFCRADHSRKESAIDFPKMRCYAQLMKDRKELLNQQ